MSDSPAAIPPIKCVVWDLDNTIWNGVLLEGAVVLNRDVVQVLSVLDERGILHSIASRNHPDLALAQLKSFNIDHFFLQPQIGWGAKSTSIGKLAADLNLGLNTFAFVDDDAFERGEVASVHPDIACFDVGQIPLLPVAGRFSVQNVTEESRNRREMYRSDVERKVAETAFTGASQKFLKQSEIVMDVWPARRDDLDRAEELTLRTNQLNATGKTYDKIELEAMRQSPMFEVLMVGLRDRFGAYGTIGMMLLHKTPSVWTLKLLLTSCRVMSRGIGQILLTCLKSHARAAGVELYADFVETGRNRIMYLAYGLAGFNEASACGDDILMKADLATKSDILDWLHINWKTSG